MYSRNRIYISKAEQERLERATILVGGAGLGSVISECLLRLGILNFIIIDYDKVEISNLNRQNYLATDIGKSKVESLYKRLISINPEANITIHDDCLNADNLSVYLKGFDIAVNTLDFTSEIPFVFDDFCLQQNKPVIHPYNFGWASCVFVIDRQSKRLQDILTNEKKPEIDIVEFILKNSQRHINLKWLEKALTNYMDENAVLPPPQLSVASWITGGICAKIAFDLIVGNEIRAFPEFYFTTI